MEAPRFGSSFFQGNPFTLYCNLKPTMFVSHISHRALFFPRPAVQWHSEPLFLVDYPVNMVNPNRGLSGSLGWAWDGLS